MQTGRGYTDTATELKKRIFSLIEKDWKIMELENPFDLFSVDGFSCDDLSPSLAQASWALSTAKQEYADKRRKQPKTDPSSFMAGEPE